MGVVPIHFFDASAGDVTFVRTRCVRKFALLVFLRTLQARIQLYLPNLASTPSTMFKTTNCNFLLIFNFVRRGTVTVKVNFKKRITVPFPILRKAALFSNFSSSYFGSITYKFRGSPRLYPWTRPVHSVC